MAIKSPSALWHVGCGSLFGWGAVMQANRNELNVRCCAPVPTGLGECTFTDFAVSTQLASGTLGPSMPWAPQKARMLRATQPPPRFSVSVTLTQSMDLDEEGASLSTQGDPHSTTHYNT